MNQGRFLFDKDQAPQAPAPSDTRQDTFIEETLSTIPVTIDQVCLADTESRLQSAYDLVLRASERNQSTDSVTKDDPTLRVEEEAGHDA